MNICFDENLPPVFAYCLDGYFKKSPECSAISVRDHFQGFPDEKWINELRNHQAHWVIFTHDKNMRKNPQLKQIWLHPTLIVIFIRQKSFYTISEYQRVARIFSCLDTIKTLSSGLYYLPMKGTNFKRI